ncbi:MAG: triose-phosphate isomerase [Deltaproteobacteria bacterium RIFOXYB12_FULL_58_9]|nr:MAG: triose-phosphate isomerase [Deltaproteobacteria bacterium RIFOXYB12_FULL_58_9]
MARKLMIAGNWKLNKTVGEALELVRDLRRLLSQVRDCEIAIAPPYTALYAVGKAIEDSPIDLAAQELFWEDSGAYTGTVSAPMLAEVGCKLVLVGHSERRQFFNETLESSGKRVKAALKAGLRPILCIGETLKEREANRTMEVVAEQLDAGIQGLSVKEVARCVIAYEPVWAIGTGKVATPAQAQEVHAAIRERLRAKDNGVAESMQILYGGSMKPDNAAELLGQADIDGGLIGGASLTAESFAGIVKARK